MPLQSTSGSSLPLDPSQELALHRVEGASIMLKFGRNEDVDTASEEDLWTGGGDYPFATGAEALGLSSNNAADTAAGTGARTVQVYGLDANWAEQNETVTLGGTATQTLTGTYMRSFRMIVRSAGTGGQNAGVLSLKGATSSATYARIENNGENQTEMAIYTVPAGKYALICRYYGSVNIKNSGSSDMKVFIRPFGEVFQMKELVVASPHFDHPFPDPLTATSQSDIKIRVGASANNLDVAGGFDLRLYPN